MKYDLKHGSQKKFAKFLKKLSGEFSMDIDSLRKVGEDENMGTLIDEDNDEISYDTGYRITGEASSYEYRIFWNETAGEYCFM